jgi:hypothetical protein
LCNRLFDLFQGFQVLLEDRRRPLEKVAYFDLACAVMFGSAAAIAGIEFGREAEDQVVEVTEDLLTIVSLGGGPVLAMRLISSFARRRTSGRAVMANQNQQ